MHCTYMKRPVNMTYLKVALIFMLLYIFVIPVQAQNTKISGRSTVRKFAVLTPEIFNLGKGVIQDSDGFFWFTSYNNGLYQWNGRTVKVYKPSNSGLTESFTNALYEDRDGLLWIGTNSTGLNKYNKETNTFTVYKNDPEDSHSISSNRIGTLSHSQVIIEDRDGFLWIGTRNGLNRLDRGRKSFVRYHHEPDDSASLVNNEINAVLEDRKGRLWIGTQGGLSCFNKEDGRFTNYPHNPDNPKSLSNNQVNTLYQDKEGVLWIGTQNGLNKFDKANSIFSVYKHDDDQKTSRASNIICEIIEDDNGYLWVTHYPANIGLSIFDKKNEIFTNYQQSAIPFSLGSNDCKPLYKDSSGVIWVISESGTLSKYDPEGIKFTSFQQNPADPKSLKSTQVVGLYEDRQGTMWVGAYVADGLHVFNRDTSTFEQYDVDGKVPISLFESSDGLFWIGGVAGTLNIFDRKRKTITKTYKITDSFISHISEDKHDSDILWLTTYVDGLVKFNKVTEEVAIYKNAPEKLTSLSYNQIWCRIFQDDFNPELFMVGTFGGLNLFNKKTAKVEKVFTHDKNNPLSISNDNIASIHKSAAGEYWISTLGGGLNRFDQKTQSFARYSAKNELLPTDTLCGILEDNDGYLWIATGDMGILRFSPETGSYTIYKKSDGVNFGGCYVVGSFRTRNGEMWFSGDGGVTYFDPKQVKDNLYQPPVYITALTQGGEPLPLEKAPERMKTLTLNWRNPYFEFEMAALNYRKPEKNQYRYILNGWDSKWYDAGTLNRGRYSGLTGGEYTLKVMGSNNDGVWSNKVGTLTIVVTSPFWKTSWFYTLCVIIIFGALAARFINAEARRRELEIKVNERTEELNIAKKVAETAKEKAEIANNAKSEFLANMSHEIRTPMNAILGFTEIMITRVKEPLFAQYLESIYSSGKSLLRLINDILDLSKVEAGKMELEYTVVSPQQLFGEMEIVFGQKITEKGLNLIIDIPPELPKALLLDERRLRQILINLIGNAVKFTESGYIKLSINFRYQEDLQGSTLDFIFSVEDTGIGIPLDQQDSVFGAFSQIKGQKTSKFGGTGLGLAITNRLIEMMDGEISVSSEVGKGTVFSIVIKNVEVASVEVLETGEEKTIELSSILFEKCSILIVDDIDFNRELLKGFIEDYDFVILEAENGLEAIEKAKQYRPQLILLDMKMPVMDGYETANALEKDNVLKEIPVIAVTASAMKKDEEAISKFCDSYLRKPVNKTDLILEIMKFLPHTVKEVSGEINKPDSESSLELSSTDLENNPELLKIIKNEQLRCLQLLRSMAINKIEDFAKEMKDLGIRFSYQPLIIFGDDLYISTQTFDTEQIQNYLINFQTFV